jgi:hypothetical protein
VRTPAWLGKAGDRIVDPPEGQPAVLYYDIETTPQLQYAWGSGKWDTRPLKVVKPRYILSVAYKWEGGDRPHFVGINQDPAFVPDHPFTKPKPRIDRWVLGALWHLFDLADMTVAHNNDRFDLKRTNARMIAAGMPPPRPSKSMDTLKMYRKVAAFPSNSLNELARELDLGEKVAHSGKGMWFECMTGNPNAWANMERYNLMDVELLYDVYHTILPWMTNNPGLNTAGHVIDGRPVLCPKPGCNGDQLVSRGTRQKTSTGLRYRTWQCVGVFGCGGYSTSRYAERDVTPTAGRIR